MQTSELGACTSQSENVNVLGTFADMRTFKNLVRDSDFFDPISPTACRQTGPSLNQSPCFDASCKIRTSCAIAFCSWTGAQRAASLQHSAQWGAIADGRAARGLFFPPTVCAHAFFAKLSGRRKPPLRRLRAARAEEETGARTLMSFRRNKGFELGSFLN